jgi:hypothetical protein
MDETKIQTHKGKERKEENTARNKTKQRAFGGEKGRNNYLVPTPTAAQRAAASIWGTSVRPTLAEHTRVVPTLLVQLICSFQLGLGHHHAPAFEQFFPCL